MGRRLLIFLVALAAAIVLAILFRVPLAQSLGEIALERSGLPAPHFTLAQLDWNEAEISQLTLGEEDEVALEGLTVIYRPLALLQGQLDKVFLDKISVKLDVTGDAPIFGSLNPFIEQMRASQDQNPNQSADATITLPEVTVEQAHIMAETSDGPVTVKASGKLNPGSLEQLKGNAILELEGFGATLAGTLDLATRPDQALAAQLVLRQGTYDQTEQDLSLGDLGGTLDLVWRSGLPEEITGRFALQDLKFAGQAITESTIALDLLDSDLSLKIDANLPDGKAALAIKGTLAEDFGLSETQADWSLSFGPKAELWNAVSLPAPPSAGRVTLTSQFTGSLPSLLTTDPKTLYPWLVKQQPKISGALRIEDLTLPQQVEGLDLNMAADVKLQAEGPEIVLAEAASLSLQAIDPSLSPDIDALRDILGNQLSLALAKDSLLFFALDDTQIPQRIDWSGTATLTSKSSATVTAAGPVSLVLDENLKPTALRSDDLALTANTKSLSGTPLAGLDLVSTIKGFVDLRPQTVTGESDALPAHEISTEVSKLSLRLRDGKDLPIAMTVSVPRLSLVSTSSAQAKHKIETRLQAGRVDLPAYDVRLGGLSLATTLDTTGLIAPLDLKIAKIEDRGENTRFAPVAFTARLTPVKDRFDVKGALTLAMNGGPLNLTGSLWPDQGRAKMDVDLPALIFAQSGLQPEDLSPLLAGAKAVTGVIASQAKVEWRDDTLSGQAEVSLDDMALTYNGIKVTGLAGKIAFDQLPTLSSPPNQTLTLDSVDPGVPVKDIDFKFQLLPGEPVKVLIESASFRSSGGRFQLGKTLFDPTKAETKATLQVVRLDLEELLADYPVEGLTLTGRMAGSIPVILRSDGFEIGDAQLSALSPGLLKYQSETSSRALQSGGESVELMLQALEDFRYSEFKIKASKDLKNNADITFNILGNNPKTLDGYPFQFNINLTGNMDPILAAVAQGLEISDNLIQRTWKLSP